MTESTGHAAVAAASGTTIDAVFRRAFAVFADRVAVTSEDGSITYAELRDQSWRLAHALSSLGLKRGDRLAILSETRPEYVAAYAAVAALGVTAVTLNIRLHPDELSHCLALGRVSAVLFSGALTAVARRLSEQTPHVACWIGFDAADGFISYQELLAAASATEPPTVARAEDIHNVLFTSGTTGRPKGAMISQRAAAIRGLRLAQWFRLDARDGFIGWLPLFHCAGDELLYATMICGGKYATLRRADVDMMFRMIARDRLTWTLLLPGVLTDFLNHPRRGDYDLTSFRFAIGYANMMPRIIEQLTAACNIDFYDAFGQSEASYLVTHGVVRPGEAAHLRKLPSPLLDIRIVDDEMNETPPGVPGECVVRGPSVMSGYLDDEAATKAAFRGGWLHTGDLLRREADGTLSFVDRKKYLIKTGGENIYPAEVEIIISQHPAVQEVCVFGLPDARWGETIKAVVVLRPGPAVSGKEIVAWCRERLASYKRPRYVQFLAAEDLPRSTTGKLLRHELAALKISEDQEV